MNKNGYKGFTLLEILGVIAVIGLIAGIVTVAITTSLRRGRASADRATAKTIATDINTLLTSKQLATPFNGYVPPTGPTVVEIPTSGVSMAGVGQVFACASFERVLLAYGIIDRPYAFGFGGPRNNETNPLYYNLTNSTFMTANGADPAAGTTVPFAPSVRSATAQAEPFAAGTNFYLVRYSTQIITPGTTLFYLYYPRLDAREALALAEAFNQPGTTLPAAGQALTTGPVTYAAANSANQTAAYVFLLIR